MSEALGTQPLMVVASQTSPADPRLTPLPVNTATIKNDHLEYADHMVLAGSSLGDYEPVPDLPDHAPKGRLTPMRYISTRGTAPSLSFEEAMLTGLARDGGLYVPEEVPTLSHAQIAAMAGKSYEEVAFDVMRPFIGDTFTDDEFRKLITQAYAGFGHAARAPLVQLDSNHFLLELFHGPTLAFKDFAMQLIGQMFQAALTRSGERVTIVGATSGDTGSAAIEAFRGLKAVDVFILYPHGRVSEVQRRQMTTPTESNVHALAVDGDFDDCQAAVKDMFNDFDLPRRGQTRRCEFDQLGPCSGASGLLLHRRCVPWRAAPRGQLHRAHRQLR